MDVHAAIETRRATRSLDPVEITSDLVRDLASHARLAPSCSNNQPWRFVFVRDPEKIEAMKPVFSEGNKWCHAASLIVAVFSRKEDDCVIKDREYHLFDTGMATAFLMLRATELGLVAHPIAGYSPKKARAVLGIPEEYQVITLVLVGKRSAGPNPVLSSKQLEAETIRPPRLPLEKFAFVNTYGG
ncbi:MAG: nitroreductase family protein [Candidatus Aminicenantes bacterium]|nr:nitroreductase family protein [Candidatus Aminicenantes bacterium]